MFVLTISFFKHSSAFFLKPFSILVCIDFQHSSMLTHFLNTRQYWFPIVIYVDSFFQYSFVLISNTRPCWPIFSILVRINFQHSFVFILFSNTRLYWFPTLVCVNPFFNTHPYWFSTLIHIYSQHSFMLILPFSILVRIDSQNSSMLTPHFFNTYMYWRLTLVCVNHFPTLVRVKLFPQQNIPVNPQQINL